MLQRAGAGAEVDAVRKFYTAKCLSQSNHWLVEELVKLPNTCDVGLAPASKNSPNTALSILCIAAFQSGFHPKPNTSFLGKSHLNSVPPDVPILPPTPVLLHRRPPRFPPAGEAGHGPERCGGEARVGAAALPGRSPQAPLGWRRPCDGDEGWWEGGGPESGEVAGGKKGVWWVWL